MQTTSLKPLPHYFLIKSPIKDENEKREKIGRFFIPPNMAYMERNLQFGIIEGIGSIAAKDFPEAKVGDLMIVHHFVQGSDKEHSEYFIHADNEYNYYIVTASNYNGNNNQCYGVWNGETIIPNKEYVFLEVETKTDHALPVEDIIAKKTEQKGSLIVFSQWNETREDIEEKMKETKARIQRLSKTKMTEELQRKIGEMEGEIEAMSAKINKKQYSKYKVVYANPETKIQSGDTAFCLNISTLTIVGFMGKEYRLVQTKYVAGIAS